MIGHKLNGGTVIAAVPDINRVGETCVVVEIPARPSLGLPNPEYVTGLVRSDDPTPSEWHAEHYFIAAQPAGPNTEDARNARARAIADMLARTGWVVEVPA